MTNQWKRIQTDVEYILLITLKNKLDHLLVTMQCFVLEYWRPFLGHESSYWTARVKNGWPLLPTLQGGERRQIFTVAHRSAHHSSWLSRAPLAHAPSLSTCLCHSFILLHLYQLFLPLGCSSDLPKPIPLLTTFILQKLLFRDVPPCPI